MTRSPSLSPVSSSSSPAVPSGMMDDSGYNNGTTFWKPATRKKQKKSATSCVFVALVSIGLGIFGAAGVGTTGHSSTEATALRRAREEKEEVLDVLIVGAGWAGLTAARRLQTLGIDNFEIWEARDSAGGRSRTVYPFGPSAPDLAVEIGSAWTYEDTEPHQMMLSQNLPYGQVHYDMDNPNSTSLGLYDAHGEVTGARKQEWIQLWRDYMKYAEQQFEKLEHDQPYQELFQTYLAKEKLSSQATRFLQTMIQAQIEIEYNAPVSQLSSEVADHNPECIFCQANHYVPVDGGGFDKILGPLTLPLADKLQFHRVVTHIDYAQGKVTAVDRANNDKSYVQYAKTILVTVPLGVLKKQTIDFQPPLPPAKLHAINIVGFGVLNKCILYWRDDQSAWWPQGQQILEFVPPPNHNKDSSFTTFFNEHELGNGGHYVLSAWIGGAEAVAMEQQSDQQILAKVLSNLQTMLGNHNNSHHIPPPTHHVISRWGQDEFAFGSYTYTQVKQWGGKTSSARRELGTRTGDKLFWAGEATHEGWSGTTVGAFKSGKTAAEDIALTLAAAKASS